MKRFRQIVSVMLVAVMLTVLGACASGDGDATTTDASTAASSGSEAQTDTTTDTSAPAENPASEEGNYRVGVLFPRSGDLAFFTAYFAPILDIYVNNLNADGGINGHPVELVYKDSQGDPSITAQRLDEFKEENVSAIIGPFFDTGGPVAAQWAQENKIPVLMCCALATDVGMENASRYVFTAGSSAWAWAKTFAEAVKEKGYTRAYYVGNEGGVPDDVYNYFWEEVENQNINVENVGVTRLSGSETDLSAVITSIMAANPDVIVTSLTNVGAVNLITQGDQFGLFDETDLFGVYIAGADHTESIGDAYPVGKIWAIDWFPVNFSATTDFAKQIQDESGGIIPNSASLTYYYAADTLCAALGSLDYEDRNDSDKLVKALEEVRATSVLGTPIYYTTYSHQLVFPMYFAGTAFDDDWGGIACLDEGDSILYGEEVYPTEAEWKKKAAELGYKTTDELE